MDLVRGFLDWDSDETCGLCAWAGERLELRRGLDREFVWILDERDGEVNGESATAHHIEDVPVENRSSVVAYLRSGFWGSRSTLRQFTCRSEHFILGDLAFKEYSRKNYHSLSVIDPCCTVPSTVHTSSENVRNLRPATLCRIVLPSPANLDLT
jgi:hypothetical protein